MDSGHQRRALARSIERRLKDAFLGPRLTLFRASIKTLHRGESSLLPGELDERIFLSGDVDHRQRGRGLTVGPQTASDRADGRQDLRAGLPEQVAEGRPVGVAHGVDATVIDGMLLL